MVRHDIMFIFAALCYWFCWLSPSGREWKSKLIDGNVSPFIFYTEIRFCDGIDVIVNVRFSA